MGLKGYLYLFMGVLGIFMLIFCLRQKKPLKTAVSSAFLGLLGVFAVHTFSAYIGIAMTLNLFTVGTSLILGLPGVISLLFCNLL